MLHLVFRAAALLAAVPVAAQTAIPMPAAAAEAEAPGAVEAGDLRITGAFARATLPNAPVSGGYMTIENAGAQPDRLLSATSPISERIEVHEMRMDGDVMRMRALAGGLTIPAGKTVTLAPGGAHLMLMGLTGPLIEGRTIPLRLEFERAGGVEVEIPVAATNAREAAPKAADGHGEAIR